MVKLAAAEGIAAETTPIKKVEAEVLGAYEYELANAISAYPPSKIILVASDGGSATWSADVFDLSLQHHAEAHTALQKKLTAGRETDYRALFTDRLHDVKAHIAFNASINSATEPAIALALTASTVRLASTACGVTGADLAALERAPFANPEDAENLKASLLELAILAAKGAEPSTIAQLGEAYFHAVMLSKHTTQGDQAGSEPVKKAMADSLIRAATLQANARQSGDTVRDEALERLVKLTMMKNGAPDYSLRRSWAGEPVNPDFVHMARQSSDAVRARLIGSPSIVRTAAVTAVGTTLALGAPLSAAAQEVGAGAVTAPRVATPSGPTAIPRSFFGTPAGEAAGAAPTAPNVITLSRHLFGAADKPAAPTVQVSVPTGVTAGVRLQAAVATPQAAPLAETKSVVTPEKPAATALDTIKQAAKTLGVSAAAANIAAATPEAKKAASLTETNAPLAQLLSDRITALNTKAKETTQTSDAFAHIQSLLARATAMVQNPGSIDILSDADKKALLDGTGTGLEKLIGTQSDSFKQEIATALQKDIKQADLLAGLSPEQQKLMLAMLATVDLATKPTAEVQAMLAAAEPKTPAPETPAAKPATPETVSANADQLLKAIEFAANKYGWSNDKVTFMKAVAKRETPIVIMSAMAGNAGVESAGYKMTIQELDPNVAEADKGLGYFQDTGGRRTDLEKDAQAFGIDLPQPSEKNAQFQIDRALAAMKDRKPRDGGPEPNEWSAMLKIQNPKEAAAYFQWNYERPKSKNPQQARLKEAQSVYDQIIEGINALAPKPAPAEGVKNPTRPSDCAEGTVSLGFFDTAGDGTIRLCAILNTTSTSQESQPKSKGNPYGVPGAEGRILINAEISQRFMDMVNAAKNEAGLDLLKIPAGSSFRTYQHQKDLCDNDAACSNGDHRFIAKEGESRDNHEAGKAIDYNYGVGISKSNCVWESNVCKMPHKPGTLWDEYTWIRANGPRFGVYPLGIEFWHIASKNDPAYIGSPAWKAKNGQ